MSQQANGMGNDSEEISMIGICHLCGRECWKCAFVNLTTSLLSQLQAFQHGEFRVDGFSLAAAIVLVQVGTALRAEAFALLSAEGFHRHGHQHLLLDGVAQVDLLPVKKDQADLLGAKLDFRVLRRIGRLRLLSTEGQDKVGRKGGFIIRQAAAAGEANPGLETTVRLEHLTDAPDADIDGQGHQENTFSAAADLEQ